MSHRIAPLLALGLTAWVGAANAVTGPTASGQSMRVAYGDLDLSHAAGADALYARLRYAAAQVCNPSDTMELRTLVSNRACAARALDDAVVAINAPTLTAVHTRTRSG
jgi:UrcA family protein